MSVNSFHFARKAYDGLEHRSTFAFDITSSVSDCYFIQFVCSSSKKKEENTNCSLLSVLRERDKQNT